MPNVIVTPHLAASTEEAQVKVAQELAETLRDYFLTGAVRNAVNLPALDAEQFKELEKDDEPDPKLTRIIYPIDLKHHKIATPRALRQYVFLLDQSQKWNSYSRRKWQVYPPGFFTRYF